MNSILKFLALVYFLIWIAIGAAFLVGIVFVASAKPWQIFTGASDVGALPFGSSEGIFSLLGGGSKEVNAAIAGLQDPAKRKSAYDSLTAAQKSCITQKLGADTVQKLLQEKTFSPSASQLFAASACIGK